MKKPHQALCGEEYYAGCFGWNGTKQSLKINTETNIYDLWIWSKEHIYEKSYKNPLFDSTGNFVMNQDKVTRRHEEGNVMIDDYYPSVFQYGFDFHFAKYRGGVTIDDMSRKAELIADALSIKYDYRSWFSKEGTSISTDDIYTDDVNELLRYDRCSEWVHNREKSQQVEDLVPLEICTVGHSRVISAFSWVNYRKIQSYESSYKKAINRTNVEPSLYRFSKEYKEDIKYLYSINCAYLLQFFDLKKMSDFQDDNKFMKASINVLNKKITNKIKKNETSK